VRPCLVSALTRSSCPTCLTCVSAPVSHLKAARLLHLSHLSQEQGVLPTFLLLICLPTFRSFPTTHSLSVYLLSISFKNK
jgi:hypothetical protein